VRAGIREFDRFGVMNSIDSMAGGDFTEWNKVLKQPMQNVILKMKMNNQQHKYNTKMAEIMKNKAQ
jgi:hypothetical protein